MIGFNLSGSNIEFLQVFKDKDPEENSELALELSQSPLTEKEQRFVQMSDTQLGMMNKPIIPLLNNWDMLNEDLEQEVANFNQAIQFTNRINPSFAIICGDLVNDRKNIKQRQAFANIVNTVSDDIPLYLVSGNHDVDNEPSKESLTAYRDTYGNDWYSFRSKNLLGIVLNSSVISSPDTVPEDAMSQKIWLKHELYRAKNLKVSGDIKFVFVFQHHPYLIDRKYEGTESVLGGEEGEKYLELFIQNEVDAVFAGHSHSNHVGQFKNMKMITTGAIGLADPMSLSRSGLRVVKVGGDNFEHAFIALEEIR